MPQEARRTQYPVSNVGFRLVSNAERYATLCIDRFQQTVTFRAFDLITYMSGYGLFSQ